MALTKVKLISDGVITVDNLNENHGITTTHIGEGDKCFTLMLEFNRICQLMIMLQ